MHQWVNRVLGEGAIERMSDLHDQGAKYLKLMAMMGKPKVTEADRSLAPRVDVARTSAHSPFEERNGLPMDRCGGVLFEQPEPIEVKDDPVRQVLRTAQEHGVGRMVK